MTVTPPLLWFLVGLALVLLEFAVPGVILVFFGVGAWIVAVTAQLGLTGTLESQLLLFAVASCVLLFCLRKWIKGKFYGHVTGVQDPSKNLDEFTGKSVVVLSDVVPGKPPGTVEFKGATWRAVSEERIRKDEIAVITGIDGITLKIGKRKEE